MPYATCLLISFIWGSNFILMNRAAQALGPVDIAVCRLWEGGGVLLMWWWWSDRQQLAARDWPHIALVALIGNTAPFVIVPLLVARDFGHSFFALMITFVPLLTILSSVVLLRQWPTWRQIVGVLVGLAALMTLFWEGLSRGITAPKLALAFTVPMVYALANTYVRWKLASAPTIPMTSFFFLLGGLFLVPLWTSTEALQQLSLVGPADPQRWPASLASIAWLGIVGTGLAGVMFVRLIQTHGPLFAGMITYLMPLVALGWGAYDHETITLRQMLAMTIVLATVTMVQSSQNEGR